MFVCVQQGSQGFQGFPGANGEKGTRVRTRREPDGSSVVFFAIDDGCTVRPHGVGDGGNLSLLDPGGLR